ncbi:MAG: sigma-70 family RNA polymerase sigma factor [Proteobacteria bacterium]|nr:sigma-70 family RNA polymerase sigma factor [Pseudomonadota bacterium]MDA0929039.1 sigma-70 family RNA polymerase sigma factor [Pseudomonadota bacterium]
MLAQYQQAITQHRQRVFSFAHYSLRAKEDAEDITQEVFIKLWQHWQKIDHSKLGAWLMRVAHNAVIDHVRKQKNVASQTDDYAEPEEQAAEALTEQQVDDGKFKEVLMASIKLLDDPFRSIIIMRDIQGMSYGDIQHTLDMSESQVKVYLHRGRRKLRENPVLRKLFDTMTGRDAGQKKSSAQVKADVVELGKRK